MEKIVLSADIDKDDCVIEIGPGLGVMTSYLAERANKVIAVEIDKKLIPVLEHLKEDYENIEIVNEDVLKLDINKEIIEKYCSDKNVKVVANLPYYITTPIIMKFLEENVMNLESMTFLVQKEVAERICAKPGGKEYGMLTVAVNYFAYPKSLFKVSPSVFIPKPNVDSSVIRFDVRKERPFHLKEGFLLQGAEGFFCPEKENPCKQSFQCSLFKCYKRRRLQGFGRDGQGYFHKGRGSFG